MDEYKNEPLNEQQNGENAANEVPERELPPVEEPAVNNTVEEVAPAETAAGEVQISEAPATETVNATEDTAPAEPEIANVTEDTTPVEAEQQTKVQEGSAAVPPLAEPQKPFENPPQNAVNPAFGQWRANHPAFSYTAVENGGAKSSKGLKIFCIVLAAIVAITGACSVGYLFGRMSLSPTNRKHTEIDLAARPTSGDEMTEAEVYEKLNESVVGIRVYNNSEEYSDCSGVVYSNDGYIVSNDHIYDDIPGAKFKVYTYDGKEYNATYVAGDQISDLTILKLEGASLKAATFGDSDELFCGEHVVAIGRPSGVKGASSITSGVITLPKRRVRLATNYSANLIETDSAINPGSSGGALVDMYGNVVGITSSKLAGSVYDSVCFAIPSRTVKRICEELIKEGKVTSRARLGITYTEIDSVAAEVRGIDTVGLYIADVSTESELYGKLYEGDIMTHINGIKITADTIVLDIIENSRAGDKITITIAKVDGGTAEFTVTLLANEGASSYLTEEEAAAMLPEDDGSEESSSPSFNFPFGE